MVISPKIPRERLRAAFETAQTALLAERVPGGHWTGELSTSALSTATAAFALTLVDRARGRAVGEGSPHEDLVLGGLTWLSENANVDGGWGDTVRSQSNPSTTTLCWAALGAVPAHFDRFSRARSRAEEWLTARFGAVDPDTLAREIIAIYGEDRTFSVPILTMCNLAGCLGDGADSWRDVIPLPFELAALPHSVYRFLGMPVVSYALPALIAVGQVRHSHRPSENPLLRFIRDRAAAPTLKTLGRIQPRSGGFLEAVPLTSFVTMSLAGCDQAQHETVDLAVEFLRRSVRADGSWPIDSNLATWVTTLSVNAFAEGPSDSRGLEEIDRSALKSWLLGQQYRQRHPYTNAAPGGWAWTDLPGGVPDADDTSGALLAIRRLCPVDHETRVASGAGIEWLLNLQNRDGGIPTFCRGWGKLPFDRSSPDLTAHFLRALSVWESESSERLRLRMRTGMRRALLYLEDSQHRDGSWTPLWFGHQDAPRFENPTYGTARVLSALREVSVDSKDTVNKMRRRAVEWLLSAQNVDGGWGGLAQVDSSVEESALALESLLDTAKIADVRVVDSLNRGLEWLVGALENRLFEEPSPIGFYFANLWYYEKLYPLIFSVGALGRALRASGPRA